MLLFFSLIALMVSFILELHIVVMVESFGSQMELLLEQYLSMIMIAITIQQP